jgi:hypothetical protein
LLGSSLIARGCQSDPDCWADTYDTCESLLAQFDALNPETFVDEVVQTLTARGMMRARDQERAQEIRNWLVARQTDLPAVLAKFRYLPDSAGVCPDELVACDDGGCGTPEDCATRLCPIGKTWCEATQACVGSQEPCSFCEGETPISCPADNSCVADDASCSERCAAKHGAGWIYCADYGSCEHSLLCGQRW